MLAIRRRNAITLKHIRFGRPIRNVLLLSGLAIFGSFPAHASFVVPWYNLGDTLSNDVTTPVPLIVIDLERTEKVRLQQAQRIAPIVKFFPEMSAMVESNFHLAFSTNRDRFFQALESSYKQPTITTQAIAQPRFAMWVDSQQRHLRPFPLTTNMAESWALGDRTEVLEREWTDKLRAAMSNHIRADQLPPEGRIGPSQWRVIPLMFDDPPEELEWFLRQTNSLHKTNIFTIGRVRKELVASFPTNQQAIAKYVGSFIRTNCVIDTELTREARAAKTNSLWAADSYQAGQTIATAGQMVDSRIKAALDQLREKLQAQNVQEEALKHEFQASAAITRANAKADAAQQRLRMGSLGAIALFCLAAIGGIFWRRRVAGARSEWALTTQSDNALLTAQDASAVGPVQVWQSRALVAERRVAKLTHAVRIRMAPHLARWLAQKFVRQLLSHRKQLVEVQQQAEAEINELERRLSQIRAPFEERIRAYEERIAQLEKVLATKEQQNRDLIEITIATARKKLALEHTKSSSEWF